MQTGSVGRNGKGWRGQWREGGKRCSTDDRAQPSTTQTKITAWRRCEPWAIDAVMQRRRTPEVDRLALRRRRWAKIGVRSMGCAPSGATPSTGA